MSARKDSNPRDLTLAETSASGVCALRLAFPMGKLGVFLVDDHTIFVDSLQVLLATRAEYQVGGKAADCTSAIEAVKACRPNGVLLDLSMPDMGGIEATRQILAAPPRTRVVALTMHKEEAFLVGFFQAGG